jgi:hypothetical protein
MSKKRRLDALRQQRESATERNPVELVVGGEHLMYLEVHEVDPADLPDDLPDEPTFELALVDGELQLPLGLFYNGDAADIFVTWMEQILGIERCSESVPRDPELHRDCNALVHFHPEMIGITVDDFACVNPDCPIHGDRKQS